MSRKTTKNRKLLHRNVTKRSKLKPQGSKQSTINNLAQFSELSANITLTMYRTALDTRVTNVKCEKLLEIGTSKRHKTINKHQSSNLIGEREHMNFLDMSGNGGRVFDAENVHTKIINLGENYIRAEPRWRLLIGIGR